MKANRDPQTAPHVCERLLYDRWVYQINQEEMDMSLNSAGKIKCLYGRKPKQTPNWFPTSHQTPTLILIKYLSGKGKNIRLFEENVGESHYDFRVGKDFLNKKRLIKFDYIKIKNFCWLKGIIKKVKFKLSPEDNVFNTHNQKRICIQNIKEYLWINKKKIQQKKWTIDLNWIFSFVK